MTSFPGTPTDLPSSSGTRRCSPAICSQSISSTTISPVSSASSTLTDLERLCRIDGNSRTIAFEEATKGFSATFSAGKPSRLHLRRLRRCLRRTPAKIR
ncbi:heat stress transcription factor b-2c [Phtheirospermum japonicum]|uniref:Heat stress transcription factor b-2c n=1 Tax=Phtheirospermum japonicum TaxID=374723 RepID=A0A830BI39_9LAMI|nr:heat stress transcription factor b-2c [Phtheirospermum japonicum]